MVNLGDCGAMLRVRGLEIVNTIFLGIIVLNIAI